MECATTNCGPTHRLREFSKGGEKYGSEEGKEKEEISNKPFQISSFPQARSPKRAFLFPAPSVPPLPSSEATIHHAEINSEFSPRLDTAAGRAGLNRLRKNPLALSF
jgi:hypothetical protein